MRGLAWLAWATYFQANVISPYSLPYEATNPLTYEKQEYKTLEDIWETVEGIAEVNSNTTRSLGQDLYHLVPLFTNPDYISNYEQMEMLNEYNMVKNFNISLGTLEDISAQKLDCFTVIHNEYQSAMMFDRNQKNGK